MRFLIFPFVFFGVLGSFFLVGLGFSDESIITEFRRLPLLSHIQRLAQSAEKQVLGESEDRINVLLLGSGGPTHDAGTLTDTMMIVSFKPSTGQVAMTSIPRDLIVPIHGHGWGKINSVNAFAEMETPGSGPRVTAQSLSATLLSEPIHYYVSIDFDGFSELIDDLGGIEVCAERGFDDYSYPIRGQEDNPDYYSRFSHLHVEAGCQKMTGDFALKYARSRHAAGAEGSDFARAARQQLVLNAIKDKVLSPSTFLNPKKISDLYETFRKNVGTNIEMWEVLRMAKFGRDINTSKIIHKVLNNGPDGLLRSAISEQGAYILEPRSGDFSEIQKMFKNIFFHDEGKEKNRALQIGIQNGTTISGLAAIVAEKIQTRGYVVTNIANAKKQDYARTVIYDFTGGMFPKEIALLKNILGANVSTIIPDWLLESNRSLDIQTEENNNENIPQHKNGSDMIIVLGEEAVFLK